MNGSVLSRLKSNVWRSRVARRKLLELIQAGVAMKFAIGIAVFLWLLCGAVGAWMLDDLDSGHWKEIVYGAVTLGDALNEHPVTYPGPG